MLGNQVVLLQPYEVELKVFSSESIKARILLSLDRKRHLLNDPLFSVRTEPSWLSATSLPSFHHQIPDIMH